MSARLRLLPRLSVSLYLCLFVFAGAFAADAHAGALTPSAKWMDELFQAEAFYGNAVDSAGDINRDGYDDVIVGAPLYDSPNTAAGIARIFLGTSTGVNPAAAWTVTGPGGTGGEFGTAVAGAGDVNGDGYTDILVSAVGDDLSCCYSYQGTVYLYLGTATGVSTTPARSYGPGAQGFVYFGSQITALGDVNRDGFADFAIGSRGYTNGQSSEGAVFIYYGAATPPSAASLVIEGNVSSELLSWSGRAGDVNGDTYPDVIVRGASKVHIHYGSAAGLSASPSWSAAASSVASSGFSPVAGAGDVNNDGFDDVLVSDFIDSGVGRVHLFLGSASGPATTPAMTLVSPFPSVAYGGGIAGVGDVDGDGYDDVVITAAGWSNGQTGEGRAFLHRGGPGGLSSSFAWTAESNYASGSLGKVAAAGDINNDGLADVILGATGYGNHGAAYVYFGSTAACTPPAAPSSVVVTPTANGELTLNWTTVAGAHHYVIYRALAACGTAPYARLGETESNTGTYVDKTALPGGLYSYVVKSATQANVCESDPSPCDDETSTGTCTAKPLFAGLASATSTDCGTVLTWTAATSGCPVPGNIRYHVYRDTSSTFTPSASTRIASCVSGTSYIAQMMSGGTYYYIVRAEENGCARTNEETNIVRKSGSTVLDFFDNMENPRTPAADARFATTGQAVRTTCKTYSGTYAYRLGGSSLCNSYNSFESATLVVGGNGSVDPNINGFRIPTGWTNVQLSFQNYFNSVSGRDGALLQYSTTGATGPWNSVPTGTTANSPYIVSGGYNGTILSGSVPAWTGTNTFFNTVTVNLNALAGNQVWFRFVWQTSGSASLSTSAGFYVDEMRVSGNSTSLQSVSIATGGSTAFCANASGPVVTATPSGGGPWIYDWGYRTTPGGAITTLSSLHQQTYTPYGGHFPGPGTYYLVSMVTPNCGGLTVSNELTLTVSAVPAAPAITPSGPTTFCAGGSVTLTAPAGFTYLWAPGGETTQSIVVTNPGSYTVRVTAAGGCNATSAPTVVTVNALPSTTITPSGPTTFCAGGSVTLTAPAAASWLWSTGETTQSIVVNSSGSYTVAVTGANGCSATSAATAVTVNPAEAVPTIEAGGATTFCAGGSVTLTSSEAASYLWSTGATTRSIEVSAAGSYSVTVTNANGCSATSAATAVTVNALPSAAISASGPTTFCEGGSVTLTASEGASYLWSTGATTRSIDVAATGSFTVTVTNAEGCSASSAATAVTVNAPPAAEVTASGPTTFCEGGSVTLTASAGASWLWSNGATTQSIDVTASGSYSVTVTNASGCNATSAATSVTVNALPSATISASGATTFCEGGSVTLTAPGAASYLWSNGATTQSVEVTASGSYTVTVTNASGCSATSAPAVVTVNAIPAATISASGPTTFCEGGSVTLTAAAGASYLWSNGATTQSIQVTSSGSYSVTVSSAAGCSATSAATAVTVNALPAATISASGPTTFCEGGSVTLTASAGTSWLWSTGATSQSIDVSASGSYSVTVTNAAGCSTLSASTAVTVNANPAATIGASGPTTFCAGGSVTLTASAGTSWLWSNGATTQSISVSDSGSYSVTVTNAAGCSTTSAATTTTVNANPAATIAASGPTTFCAGGSVTLTASAGASWLWSTGATSQSIEVISGGSYSVTVTNAAGCSTTSAATAVTVNPLPAATIAPSGPTTFCDGGSVTLTASAGALWLWSNGATTQSLVVSSAGNYSVTVMNASGCSATSPVTTVTVHPLPGSTVSASGPTTFCQGGSVTLTAAAGASWLWTNGATTQSINVTASGSYGVTVTGAGGCSSTAAPVAVTVNPLPAATVSAGGPTTFCEGGSVTLTASAGTSWLWSNGATTQAINVTQSGSYSVAVTNASGCTATSAATAVTVNPLPTPTVTITGSPNLCGGSMVTLTGNGGSGQWYRNGVFYSSAQSISLQFTSASFVFRIVSAAGCPADSAPVAVTYTPSYTSVTSISQICWNQQGTQRLNGTQPGSTFVWTATGGTIVSGQGTAEVVYAAEPGSTNVRLDVTITQPSGCVTNSTFNTQVDGSMKPAVTAQGPTTFCPGGSVTLDGGTAPSGYTYLWSTGATTQSITASTAGSYTVRYRRTFTGCLSTPSDPIVVTVDSVTPTITAGGPTTFCTGGSVTLTASAGSSYLWSTGATTQSINVSASGSYTVTVTNANGCSGTSAAKTVTVNPLPAATITAGGPTTFCAGGSVTLTASSGSSYLWSNGATTSSITVNASGNYSVTVTNANGCSATSAPASVTVNPLPTATITAGGPTTFCAGGSVTLTASAGSSYLWSNGATTSSIAVSTAGNYSVTVTNANGCSATSAATSVTVNPLPTATITAGGPTTFCTGGSVTLTASAGSSYLWSNGATTSSIAVNATGNYSVTVTNANGCSATSAPASVTVNPLPTATITAGGPTTFCAGGSVTLTASAGASYLWSNGATTSSIAVTSTGNYSVTVTNASGCSATSSPTAVTVNAAPTATITAGGPTTFCAGGSVTLTASSGASYLWSTGATTPSIVANASGSYSVTVTNASGCSTTSSATAVTVNAAPAATITAGGPTTFCAGGSVTLTASAGASYLWSNGATTSSIVVSATGNYSVTVTNASGCSTTSSPTAVTVNAKPGSTIGTSGPTTFCTGGSVTLTAPAGTSYAWSTGATSASIVVSAAGSYGVTVTNAAGCSTAATPVTVVVNAKPATPTITPSGPTTFCPGGSVTLTAPAGFTYLWSTGATTQSIAATAAGNYTVTVTNAGGCSTTSAATTVTLNAATAITVQQANKTIPKNTSTTLSVTATGTNLTYQLYRGNVGVTTTPVGSQTSNPTLSTGVLAKGTYTFWIKVFGTCGNVNGNAITVTAN